MRVNKKGDEMEILYSFEITNADKERICRLVKEFYDLCILNELEEQYNIVVPRKKKEEEGKEKKKEVTIS